MRLDTGTNNLVIEQDLNDSGGLSHSGPAVAIDCGYTVEFGGWLTANGNITLANPITATAGAFSKSGPAVVNYTALGANVLAATMSLSVPALFCSTAELARRPVNSRPT